MNSADRRYDYLIIGAGMYGATAARALADHGSRVLVVEKRDHIAGNAYTEEIDGICVHRYGAHIFHTDSDRVWEFVNRFAVFNGFINEPLARWDGKLYSLPFNMNTFRELWGVTEPVDAKQIIEEQTAKSGYRESEYGFFPSSSQSHRKGQKAQIRRCRFCETATSSHRRKAFPDHRKPVWPVWSENVLSTTRQGTERTKRRKCLW